MDSHRLPGKKATGKTSFCVAERQRSFTLMEIIITIVIITILATVGYPIYENIIESSRQKVCRTNLQALTIAIEQSIKEGRAPTTLGALPKETIGRAYAQVLQQKGAWKVKIAQYILAAQEAPVAYAEPLITSNPRLLVCPSNRSGGRSYGLNAKIPTCRTYADFLKLPSNTVIVADCSAGDLFTDAAHGSSELDTGRHYTLEFNGPMPSKTYFAQGQAVSENNIQVFNVAPAACPSNMCKPPVSASFDNIYVCKGWCDTYCLSGGSRVFCCKENCDSRSYVFTTALIILPTPRNFNNFSGCFNWCIYTYPGYKRQYVCADRCHIEYP